MYQSCRVLKFCCIRFARSFGKSLDGSDDFIRGFGPSIRLGIFIVPLDEGSDICLQLLRRGMGAATNLLPGELGLIDPRRRRPREVHLWASSLRDVKRRMRPLFTQARVALSAENFLDGLLGEERRKTGWMRAEAAGDPGPWRQQAILGRGRWDADALRDIVRDYALEALADGDAVLVVDETGFLKQGKASCGVARQYTGSAGKITNCQIGVFACYVGPRGHAFIDRELYLPKSWTDDPARMAKAHVPQEIIDSASGGFATKPALARAMIERAIAAKVPFSFVAADSVYGVGDMEMALRRAGKGYVLGVKSNQPFHSWGKSLTGRGNGEGHRRWLAGLRVAAPFGGRGTERRAACMTGPISNSPISTPANTMRRSQGKHGRAAF